MKQNLGTAKRWLCMAASLSVALATLFQSVPILAAESDSDPQITEIDRTALPYCLTLAGMAGSYGSADPILIYNSPENSVKLPKNEYFIPGTEFKGWQTSKGDLIPDEATITDMKVSSVDGKTIDLASLADEYKDLTLTAVLEPVQAEDEDESDLDADGILYLSSSANGFLAGYEAEKRGGNQQVSDAKKTFSVASDQNMVLLAKADDGYVIGSMRVNGKTLDASGLEEITYTVKTSKINTASVSFVAKDSFYKTQKTGTVTLENKTSEDDLKKQNPDFDLSTASYGFYRDAECTELQQSASLQEKVALPVGTYYVRQIGAATGGVSDDSVQKIEVKENQSQTVSVNETVSQTYIDLQNGTLRDATPVQQDSTMELMALDAESTQADTDESTQADTSLPVYDNRIALVNITKSSFDFFGTSLNWPAFQVQRLSEASTPVFQAFMQNSKLTPPDKTIQLEPAHVYQGVNASLVRKLLYYGYNGPNNRLGAFANTNANLLTQEMISNAISGGYYTQKFNNSSIDSNVTNWTKNINNLADPPNSYRVYTATFQNVALIWGENLSNRSQICASINVQTGEMEFFNAASVPPDTDTMKYFLNFEDYVLGVNNQPWTPYLDKVKTVKVRDGETIAPKNTSCWFYGMTNGTTFDGTGFDMSNNVAMNGMFANTGFSELNNIGNWNTENCTNLSYFLHNNANIQTVDAGNWNVSNVTNLTGLFYNCSNINALDLSKWDTSKVTSLNCTFADCSNLYDPHVDHWNVGQVKIFSNVFNGMGPKVTQEDPTSWDLSAWDVSNATSMQGAFANIRNNTQYLNLSTWYAPNLADVSYMFQNDDCIKTLDISKLNTNKTTTLKDMFLDADLHQVMIGPDFSFKGAATDDSLWTIWNTPTGDDYTGNWMRIDGAFPRTAQNLVNTYDGSTMSGTWVWQRKNAELNVTKQITDDSVGMNRNFTFRITLNDPNDATQVYSGTQKVSQTSVSPAATPQTADEENLMMAAALDEENASEPSATAASEPSYSNYEKTPAYATLNTTTGEMIFSRGTAPAATSDTKVFTGFESASAVPWSAWTSSITSVRFDQPIFPINMDNWFAEAVKLNTFNSANLCLQRCQSMTNTFKDCLALKNLDLSGKDTSNLQSMNSTFMNCSNLSSISIADWYTPRLKSMTYTFAQDSALTSLDLTALNMSSVTSVEGLFKDCTNLSTINLPKFSNTIQNASWTFAGMKKLDSKTRASWNILNGTKIQSISHIFDGSTVPEAIGIPVGSANAVDASYAFANSTVNNPSFNSNGVRFGNMEGMFENCKNLQILNLTFVDMTNCTNFSNLFEGDDALWNVSLGEKCTFKGKADAANYGYLPQASSTAPYTGSWFLTSEYPDPTAYTPQQITDTYDGSKPGNYVWSSVPYEIHFDANGGEGSMATIKAYRNQAIDIPDNTFTRSGYEFLNWNMQADGLGAAVSPNSTVTNLVPDDVNSVTLYAQWRSVAQDVVFKDNQATFSIPGNTKANFNALPSGFDYKIEEETPSGWKLIAQSGTDGSLTYKEAQNASFTNQYVPEPISVTFAATKTLQGRALQGDDFSFDLLEDGKTIQSAQNDADGKIQFSPISFSTPGTYTYQIVEAPVKDQAIQIDPKVVNVNVTVTLNQSTGKLEANVKYLDTPDFVNSIKTGSLMIYKSVVAGNETITDTKGKKPFTFSVTLTDENGTQITDADYIRSSAPDTTQKFTGDPIEIGAGEYVLFKDLPVGTTYTVNETNSFDMDVNATGSQGTIQAGTENTAVANFVNVLNSQGTYPVSFGVKKQFVGAVLNDGQFTFQAKITNGDQDVDTLTATNKADGTVTFQTSLPMSTLDQTLVASITEQEGDDNWIVYDKQTIQATIVSTLSDDWKIQTNVTYSPENPTFVNKRMQVLPKTGVKGISIALISALTILCASLGIVIYSQKKRKK